VRTHLLSCKLQLRLTITLQYSTEGKIKEPNLAIEAGQGLLSAATSYARGDMGGVFKSAMSLVKTASGNTQKAEKYARATRTSPADAVSNCAYLSLGERLNGLMDVDILEWL
jgi:metacaspase-1